jgi:hypothetical protein
VGTSAQSVGVIAALSRSAGATAPEVSVVCFERKGLRGVARALALATGLIASGCVMQSSILVDAPDSGWPPEVRPPFDSGPDWVDAQIRFETLPEHDAGPCSPPFLPLEAAECIARDVEGSSDQACISLATDAGATFVPRSIVEIRNPLGTAATARISSVAGDCSDGCALQVVERSACGCVTRQIATRILRHYEPDTIAVSIPAFGTVAVALPGDGYVYRVVVCPF